jgi:DNA-binding transcriptional ArsR family regulator
MAEAAVLDQVFWALSDATRRDVVERLATGPATVSELAQPYEMSLPGFMKHLRVLEDAGLVQRAKAGRTVHCELAPKALEDAGMWLARQEKFWSERLDALGRYLYHQEEVQPWPRAPTSNNNKTVESSASRGTTRSPPRGSGAPGRTRKR